jgi:hypothetical protein
MLVMLNLVKVLHEMRQIRSLQIVMNKEMESAPKTKVEQVETIA